MFFKIFFILTTFPIFSEAAFVDRLNKCSIKDEECLKASFRDVLKDISKPGVPELGIPPIDPYEIKNETVSIVNLFNLRLTNARLIGIKDCVVDRFIIDIDNDRGLYNETCGLVTVEGDYELAISNPILLVFVGNNSIHGKGKTNLKIEQLVSKFEFPLNIKKRDGETYLNLDYDHSIFEYEIQGKLKLAIDNLYIGDLESSQVFINFFNDNWRLIINIFGKPIIDIELKITLDIASKFFNFVPTKDYLTEDLSSYAKP